MSVRVVERSFRGLLLQEQEVAHEAINSSCYTRPRLTILTTFNTELNKLLITFFALAGGCRNQDKPHISSSHSIAAPDSAALAAYDDSVVGAAGIMGPGKITPNGDTLKSYGGLMMDIEGARDYGIRHYSRNGIQYLRIAQVASREPNGTVVWTVRARLRLPPMDSTETLVLEGLCRVNDKDDPFVLGVVRTHGDSSNFRATHAWRFDLASKTLREIPTSGVTCAPVSGED